MYHSQFPFSTRHSKWNKHKIWLWFLFIVLSFLCIIALSQYTYFLSRRVVLLLLLRWVPFFFPCCIKDGGVYFLSSNFPSLCPYLSFISFVFLLCPIVLLFVPLYPRLSVMDSEDPQGCENNHTQLFKLHYSFDTSSFNPNLNLLVHIYSTQRCNPKSVKSVLKYAWHSLHSFWSLYQRMIRRK